MIVVRRVAVHQGALRFPDAAEQRLGDHLELHLAADADGATDLFLASNVAEESRSEWSFETDVRWPEDVEGMKLDGFDGSHGLPRRVWLWKVLVPLHEQGVIAGLLDLTGARTRLAGTPMARLLP